METRNCNLGNSWNRLGYIHTPKATRASGYPNSVSISCGLYDSAWLRVPSKKNVTETIETRHALFDTKVAVKLGI